MTLVIIFVLIVMAVMFQNENQMFEGLEPKATYKGYKIYDLVEQKHLMCAEAIEILDSDNQYDYYFNCLKSGNIYFVNDKEIIKVRDAYNRGIITKEKLYELGIVDRMVKLKNE